MIHYRAFRNADPPGLVKVWNQCCVDRAAAILTANLLLEYFVLAKPYFDPAGLIVALDDDQLIGFGLAGFGPTADQSRLDCRTGITCAINVLPAYQRRQVGAALLARCEEYLRARGAVELYAGPQTPLNPFTFAIYGGADSPGFLESDRPARRFLEKNGYRPHRSCLVMQRSLQAPLVLADARFASLRQRYEIHTGPRHKSTWWQEAVLGPVELQQLRLVVKSSKQTVAHLSLWEMETYRSRWNEHAIGILELEVAPELRRQSLAKFLVAQMLRHLQDQFYTLGEAQIPADSEAALSLVRAVGFGQVDVGHLYMKQR